MSIEPIRRPQHYFVIPDSMDGTLKGHLEEADQSANEMFDLLLAQFKAQDGVTEVLKASNQLEWVQRMNSIRNRAAEIVYKELIYA